MLFFTKIYIILIILVQLNTKKAPPFMEKLFLARDLGFVKKDEEKGKGIEELVSTSS
jgi:hypothetical protein